MAPRQQMLQVDVEPPLTSESCVPGMTSAAGVTSLQGGGSVQPTSPANSSLRTAAEGAPLVTTVQNVKRRGVPITAVWQLHSGTSPVWGANHITCLLGNQSDGNGQLPQWPTMKPWVVTPKPATCQ